MKSKIIEVAGPEPESEFTAFRGMSRLFIVFIFSVAFTALIATWDIPRPYLILASILNGFSYGVATMGFYLRHAENVGKIRWL